MFKEKYRAAYNGIAPSPQLVTDTIAKASASNDAAENAARKRSVLKPVAAIAAVVFCMVLTVPVCAAKVPAFYRIVEYISPSLADRLVPIEKSSTSEGITMEVEAVSVNGNEAEIILSLRDDETGTQDLVHGEIDLFDSYGLSDYSRDSIVGGCHFLTYDEAEDKAYLQVNVQTDGAYDSRKLRFCARRILCDKSSATKAVDLSGIVYEADTKRVTLSGSGGILAEEMLPDSLKRIEPTPEEPSPGIMVLDMTKVTECAADDFTITGIAYMEGVMRVQMCMGDTWEADRHVELFLKNAEGEERYPDRSVGWHEDIDGTSYQFYEFWYVGDIGSIEDYSMYGIFHTSGNLVEGNWDVTFRLQ